ncbi:MAG: hypothetical protein QNJ19_15495 [Woeseiaceae bacterium]|nr:hypothetical protein [Woeseiaceae bacterium]
MGDAVWLFLGLPKWFFWNLLDPVSAGPLSLIPFVGIVCLVVGTTLGAQKRARFLWRFGLPVLASQALVAVAGYLRGALDTLQSQIVAVCFMLVILGWSLFLVYKAKGARIPALLLAAFSLSYAAYASFVSAMSLTDNWL